MMFVDRGASRLLLVLAPSAEEFGSVTTTTNRRTGTI